ncbi:MAG: helix-turn-helix domain-containing protein [Elusimicrobia bacterium]|nr:helix-turn-helix domain-containing protein [Elusimicrobiota bacterium]
MEDKYITIPKLAQIMGISRIAVYKKVKKGEIKAIKIGRNYAINRKLIDNIFGKELNSQDKIEIDTAVRKTVKEYGEVLKLLGRE